MSTELRQGDCRSKTRLRMLHSKSLSSLQRWPVFSHVGKLRPGKVDACAIHQELGEQRQDPAKGREEEKSLDEMKPRFHSYSAMGNYLGTNWHHCPSGQPQAS